MDRVKTVFQAFTKCLNANIERVISREEELFLPVLPSSALLNVIDICTDMLKVEPTLIELTSPIVIVGDLHGHLLDLVRILQFNGMPPSSKYLFLGDIIDRGEFSIETITIIMCLKILYPNHVFIIRGNHEFPQLFTHFGFLEEIKTYYYDTTVFRHFSDMFSYMSLAALIDGSTLCVHGGLGPSVTSVKKISEIEKPIRDFSNPVVAELLWADPHEQVDEFVPSRRGTGFYFNQKATETFLDESELVRIIRAHEMLDEGYSSFFEDMVLSVFSASNYNGISKNTSASLRLKDDDAQIAFFPPLAYFLRMNAKFFTLEMPQQPRETLSILPRSSSSRRFFSRHSQPPNDPALRIPCPVNLVSNPNLNGGIKPGRSWAKIPRGPIRSLTPVSSRMNNSDTLLTQGVSQFNWS